MARSVTSKFVSLQMSRNASLTPPGITELSMLPELSMPLCVGIEDATLGGLNRNLTSCLRCSRERKIPDSGLIGYEWYITIWPSWIRTQNREPVEFMASMKISYSDLEEAFLLASYDRRYWLDKQTGRVLCYCSEAAEALEEGDLSDLPGWMDDDVSAAREVLRAFGELPASDSPPSIDDSLAATEASADEGDHDNSAAESNRYVPIEQIPSNEAFQFMSDFADDVADSRIRDVLQRALRGNRPFRRFRDALNNFPKERERWFKYESRRRRDYIEWWARDEGVELDFSAERG